MNMFFCTIPQRPPHQHIRSPVLLLLLLLPLPARAAPALPEEIHQGILTVNEKVYREDLESAENEAKKIIRKNPDHPAGYFCMAFVTDSWMSRYQSDKKENDFYRYCDMAIEKGEKILARYPHDEWASFFIGGSDGFKGTYEARYERWITAFRYGWKGVSVLMELRSSGCGIEDIYYGTGCYNYWRSALMKMLWWMPGIEDKRQKGIDQLYHARSKGLYTKTSASIALIDILLNEKRYGDALKIAEEELRYYPDASSLLAGKARALYGLQKYGPAAELLQRIIRKTELDEPDNHFNTTMYHFHLAKICMAEKRYFQAIAECNIVGNYSFEPSIRKRLDATLDEFKSIRKQALQEMANGP